MLCIWLVVIKMQRLHHFLFHSLLLLWQFSLHVLIVISIRHMTVLVRSFIIYVVTWNMSILFSIMIHTTSDVSYTEYDPTLLLSSYIKLGEKISSWFIRHQKVVFFVILVYDQTMFTALLLVIWVWTCFPLDYLKIIRRIKK